MGQLDKVTKIQGPRHVAQGLRGAGRKSPRAISTGQFQPRFGTVCFYRSIAPALLPDRMEKCCLGAKPPNAASNLACLTGAWRVIFL